MDLTNVNVDVLLAAYRQKLGITEEEEQQMIAEIQEGSTPNQDLSNMGQMMATSMENNQVVAEMLSAAMMKIEDLEQRVKELEK